MTMSVRGEVPCPGVPRPNDFDEVTLKWMVRLANLITIWSAPGTSRANEIRAAVGERAIQRWLTVETTPAASPLWHRFVHQWKRPSVEVLDFGPLPGREGSR